MDSAGFICGCGHGEMRSKRAPEGREKDFFKMSHTWLMVSLSCRFLTASEVCPDRSTVSVAELNGIEGQEA